MSLHDEFWRNAGESFQPIEILGIDSSDIEVIRQKGEKIMCYRGLSNERRRREDLLLVEANIDSSQIDRRDEGFSKRN